MKKLPRQKNLKIIPLDKKEKKDTLERPFIKLKFKRNVTEITD